LTCIPKWLYIITIVERKKMPHINPRNWDEDREQKKRDRRQKKKKQQKDNKKRKRKENKKW